MEKPIRLPIVFCVLVLLTACVPGSPVEGTPAVVVEPRSGSTATVTPLPWALYRSSSLPDRLLEVSDDWDLSIARDPSLAGLHLDLFFGGQETKIAAKTTWIYALVAPFPTVRDGVSEGELLEAWKASSPAFGGSPLWMTDSTLATFSTLWGDPAPGSVRTVAAEEVAQALWENQPAWGIVPFERLEPRLKVLQVGGQSPIQSDFAAASYPLKAEYALRALDRDPSGLPLVLPDSNREPSQITTLVLTGVTALVRATAYTMEVKGVNYPARDIGTLLRQADITHISNEIPFFTGCDFPNPSRSKLVFCSDPKYIELLEEVGTDVVELTGNHFADYGPGAMLETLDIYTKSGIPYYGGGRDLEDARQPLTLEHNGNKIAFIGCNPVDLGRPPVATDNKPGAAPCSHAYLVDTIQDLTRQGYLVIATFQHQEYYSPEARPGQMEDFHRVADAGATIVSGSQAHYPQVMEFYGDSFIHYGLGNLFFDQMGEIPYQPGIRREFADRYVVYNGKMISIELLTLMLEDYARPRPMTPAEREAFLSEYFYHSGWTPFVPTPTPRPTLTLTPMTLPRPFTTITPVP